MASKTYANLTTVTTTNDSDLVAVYPTGGPLKVIAWVNLVAKLVTDLSASLVRRDQNLADLNSAGVARTNLGLGNVAVLTTGTSSGNVAVLGSGGKTPISTLPGGYLAKSSTYSAVLADAGKLIDCTGTFTLTLPSAGTVGDAYSIDVRNIGTGVITVAPPSGTIDGEASIAIAAGTVRTILNDASNWYSTPEGAQGWTLLDTKATTSGNSVTFSNISQAYSELLFEIADVTATGSTQVNIAFSSDGASYSTAWNSTGGVASAFGQLILERYTSTISAAKATIGQATGSAPYVQIMSASAEDAIRVIRTPSGVKYVRFSDPNFNYTSGVIRLYAR